MKTLLFAILLTATVAASGQTNLLQAAMNTPQTNLNATAPRVTSFSLLGNSITDGLGQTPFGQYAAEQKKVPFAIHGHPGYTTAQIYALISEALADHPSHAVLEGGINDIVSQGATAAAVFANFKGMIDTLAKSGVVPVVLLILPNTNATDAQSATIDDANAQIKAYCNAVPSAVWIDLRGIVGKSRPSGPQGNFYDINPIYGSGDGTHFNAAGNKQIGLAIAARLN